MATLAHIVSITSGFALMRWPAPPFTTLVTSIAIDLALAPLTATIAVRRGRSLAGWLIAGLLLGAWALAAVLLLPSAIAKTTQRDDPPHYPSTSDAA